ncbi:unnamed protein product [Plutella xylostella]|uniref:(diamondback moth) hypothetical protein n=1 Tax=Plutella xylostella TaxID=51655 RepID=A0A8S4G2W9_PLUXY|nr:unnamed protein product [Plutella xylostella]
MSSNLITNIPKLKGRENYEDWAFAVENFLILEGMEKCVAKEGDPNDAKAKAKIILTIDPSLYVHIKGEETAMKLWTKLKRLFDDNGFTRRISLLRNLISIRRENCENMSQYVTSILETSQRLNNAGFKISDEWIGSLLLAGLPEKFEPMIMAVEHSGLELTADAIKTKLLDMEDGSEVCSGSMRNAFATKGTQKKRSHQMSVSNAKSNVKCYKCKQFGHFMNKCTENIPKKKESNAFSAVFLSGSFSQTDWYVDSGASSHLTSRKDWLSNTTKQQVDEIIIADKSSIPVQGCGDVQITTVVGDTEYDIPVTEVLYVPDLATNLLSVSQLMKKGNKVTFEDNYCYIYNQRSELVATADLADGVYKLKIKEVNCLFTSASGDVWHRRFGHINSKDLNLMRDGAVHGLQYKDKAQATKTNCIVCCEGKQSRLPFSHNGNRGSELLDVVHADVCGPMEHRSIGGMKYFLLFVDDYSRMAFVYFLKTKDEVFSYFKSFKQLVENQTGRKLKVLRTDNGTEFCSKVFEKYLQDAGVIHQKTCPYTPEQNGLCERLNRSVVEKARCLIYDAGLSKRFWGEAVNTAVYLRNRSIASGLNNRTPYEIWTGSKPDVSNLRIFGSKTMVHVPKERRLKWDKKAHQCILVGYSDNVKGYRVYNPNNDNVTIARDIVVIEEGIEQKQEESYIDISESSTNTTVKEEQKDTQQVGETIDTRKLESQDEKEEKPSMGEESLNSEEEDFQDSSAVLRAEPEMGALPGTAAECFDGAESAAGTADTSDLPSKRLRKRPDRYGFSNVCVSSELSANELSLHEAMNGPECEQWKLAMQSELKSFKDNDAWELVSVPPSGTIVQCKWVFKKKFDNNNKVIYRARLVAKGYMQRPGIDYDQTFAPVLRHSTLRLLFALAVQLNLDICHLDVKTAFLNGFLDENVYMMKPVGLQCNTDDDESKVLLLKRAIYGLKQSSRAWYQRVDELLQSLGYKKSDLEPCLFTKVNKDVKIIIALYVDDFFVFSNCEKETKELKEALSSKFELKDLGCIKNCLGMRVIVNKQEGSITIDQESYIEELLNKFNISECKSADTPIESKINLSKGAVGGDGDDSDDKEKEEEAERERQEAIKEAEDRRKEKHRKMEEEREKMRQEIRDKSSFKILCPLDLNCYHEW